MTLYALDFVMSQNSQHSISLRKSITCFFLELGHFFICIEFSDSNKVKHVIDTSTEIQCLEFDKIKNLMRMRSCDSLHIILGW